MYKKILRTDTHMKYWATILYIIFGMCGGYTIYFLYDFYAPDAPSAVPTIACVALWVVLLMIFSSKPFVNIELYELIILDKAELQDVERTMNDIKQQYEVLKIDMVVSDYGDELTFIEVKRNINEKRRKKNDRT